MTATVSLIQLAPSELEALIERATARAIERASRKAAAAPQAGERLTRTEMLERLRLSSKTFTARVRSGAIPSPCADGRWLLSEVLEWEAQRA